MQASAQAHPNIAFIKYWGNRDDELTLPVNGSISMNLAGLYSRTSVTFDEALEQDAFSLGGEAQSGSPLNRVAAFLDIVRARSGLSQFARVESENNFPIGSGVASSSSAFAALALAASAAAGLELSEQELSALARRGSGSASRSVPGGFVEWFAGEGDADSHAVSIADPDHWYLVDCIAIVDDQHKAVGSSAGHGLAASSPLQEARVAGAKERLASVRAAIEARDFGALTHTVELDSNLMHAVMMTSTPPLLYWKPATMAVLHQAAAWQAEGLPVATTIDAGPNVHVLCQAADQAEVAKRLRSIDGVKDVLEAHPGGAAKLLD
ncbi:MAG: diphosphomevalonate decarboxylase [Thiotrichales bacterium]|nr:diphosphomevalonate decarboxylase [Thiotrichales bacterium]